MFPLTRRLVVSCSSIFPANRQVKNQENCECKNEPHLCNIYPWLLALLFAIDHMHSAKFIQDTGRYGMENRTRRVCPAKEPGPTAKSWWWLLLAASLSYWHIAVLLKCQVSRDFTDQHTLINTPHTHTCSGELKDTFIYIETRYFYYTIFKQAIFLLYTIQTSYFYLLYNIQFYSCMVLSAEHERKSLLLSWVALLLKVLVDLLYAP